MGKKFTHGAYMGEDIEPLLGIDIMKMLGIHIDVPNKNTLIPLAQHKKTRHKGKTLGS